MGGSLGLHQRPADPPPKPLARKGAGNRRSVLPIVRFSVAHGKRGASPSADLPERQAEGPGSRTSPKRRPRCWGPAARPPAGAARAAPPRPRSLPLAPLAASSFRALAERGY